MSLSFVYTIRTTMSSSSMSISSCPVSPICFLELHAGTIFQACFCLKPELQRPNSVNYSALSTQYSYNSIAIDCDERLCFGSPLNCRGWYSETDNIGPRFRGLGILRNREASRSRSCQILACVIPPNAVNLPTDLQHLGFRCVSLFSQVKDRDAV